MNSSILHINPKNLIPQQSKEEISQSSVKKLEKDMRKRGYDFSHPISGVRRKDGRILISDGHHRVRAAIRAGLDKVPVDVHEHKGD